MIDLEESSLADIVSNVLAVLMLVTVMALLGAGAGLVSRTPSADKGGAQADLNFLEPSRSLLPTFTRHYIVTGDGLAVLMFERIADALMAEPGKYSGEVEAFEGSQAVVSFELYRFGGPGVQSQLNDREVDLTQFWLELRFPKAPFEPTMIWGAPDMIAGRVVERMQRERRGPTFLVTRSGFDQFAGLYDALAGRGVCFRWQHLSDDMVSHEYREQQMFATFQFRRCTLAP